MTVKELIKKLQSFHDDSEVSVENDDEDVWDIVKIELRDGVVIVMIEGASFI